MREAFGYYFVFKNAELSFLSEFNTVDPTKFKLQWYREIFYEICSDLGADYPVPEIDILNVDKVLVCISMGHNVQWTEKRSMPLSYDECVELYVRLLKAYKKRVDELVARVGKAGGI